jgi:pimeloyl-ACP methyl ester carboxylesterase
MKISYDVVEVNGTRLYCEIAGSGEVVVLVHGFTLDTRMWDDQFLPLARHFRVVRYDLRGFGRSALPTNESYSHVDDLNALLDRLAVRQAYLVGLSKGGGIVLDFALTHPHRTQALVLIDTILGGFPWSATGSARDRLVWQQAREAGLAAARAAWLAHPLFEPAQRQPLVAACLARMVDEYSGWHFVHTNPERRLDPPAAERLSELGMPVLALVGEYDTPDFRQVTELIGQQVKQARKLVVPGVGHMANMEAPEQVTQAVLAFLTGLAGRVNA